MSRRRWAALAAVAVLVVVAVAVGAGDRLALLLRGAGPGPLGAGPGTRPSRRSRPAASSSSARKKASAPASTGSSGRAVTRSPARSSAEDEDTVTRRLRAVDGYLAPGMEVAIDSTSTPATRPRPSACPPPPSRSRRAGTDAGLAGPGRSRTWAIVVHGINSTPETGLRIVPALHRAGLPTLLITYREDLGAPPSPDGFHHMGQTEWRDLGAAARYALAHGARRLILVGYSMGGAIVSQFMERSPLAPRVAGLVLDAPALDWKDDPLLQRNRDGLPRLRGPAGRVGDRRPYRRRLRTMSSPISHQRRFRRGAAAPGHL